MGLADMLYTNLISPVHHNIIRVHCFVRNNILFYVFFFNDISKHSNFTSFKFKLNTNPGAFNMYN